MSSIPIETHSPSVVVRAFARFISYLFHPLFIPIYLIYWLIFLHPTAFVGFSEGQKWQTLTISMVNLLVFPLFSTVLLKALGFVSSIQLTTQKDRIIPLIASGIFFFWCYLVFKEQIQYPRMLVVLVFGMFLASSAALLANIYLKVSIHAMGVGGLLGFLIWMAWFGNVMLAGPIMIALLVSGLVMSARLALQAHRPLEITVGFLLGCLAQWVSVWVV
jgi:hypothetical protein